MLTLSSRVILWATSSGIPTSFIFLYPSPVITFREENPEPFLINRELIYLVNSYHMASKSVGGVEEE